MAGCLILLLVFQVSGAMIGHTSVQKMQPDWIYESTSDTNQISDLTLDYGYDLAGHYIDFGDVNPGTVRYETGLEIYHNQVIQAATAGTPTVPDIVMSSQQEINACWHNTEGTVNYYWANLAQSTKEIQVDDVLGVDEGVVIFDCAIAVKENGRASLLYTNGSDLKAGQIAYASSLYVDGDEWHTRTILEDVNVTNVELAITPEHFEWGVFRDDNGALHSINYTGAFWQTELLDTGPVGLDFELEIASNGDVYVLYTKFSQAVLLTISNGLTSLDVIAESDNLHHDVGLTLDGSELLQLFTSSTDGDYTTLNIERSLANQANQLSSSPDYVISDEEIETKSPSSVAFADFNGDGFTDLVNSIANADTQALSANGRVSVHYGSQDGLSPIANLRWEGEFDGQMMGKGLAVGDYNGDGFDDLAIGSPGHSSNDGLVQFAFGAPEGLDEALAAISGVSNPLTSGEKYGYCLETVEDLDLDSRDELLVCSIDYQQGSDTGKVELFFGSGAEDTWVKRDSPNQMLQGSNFGQSISADGDLNGDGLVDLVIGNTGDLVDSSGFSSVEIRYGTSSGFATNPDHSYQSISAGTLFGYRVQIVNDMNNDGFDELLISEPYNTTGEFNSGNVWAFYGNSSGVADQPSARLSGGGNDLFGLNFISAGDTNDDGFNDLLITRKSGTNQGQVELVLGSAEIIDGASYFVASGLADYATAMAGIGDVNNDNLADFAFSSNTFDELQNEVASLELYSRKLFDITELAVPGVSTDGKIQASSSSVPYIVIDLVNNTDNSGSTKMISLQSNAQSNYWDIQEIASQQIPVNGGTDFVITSSGSPILMYVKDGLKAKTYTGYTGLESELSMLNPNAQYVTSAIGSNGETFVAYYAPSSQDLLISQRTESGWNEQLVVNNANISSPISLHIDSSGSPIIIYRNSITVELNIASYNGLWTINNLSNDGLSIAPSIASVLDSEGVVRIAAILDDGNYNNLSLISVDDTSTQIEFVAAESDTSTNLSLTIDDDDGLILSALTSSGSLMVYEKANNSNSWNAILLPQPQSFGSSKIIKSTGEDIPMIVVNSELNALYAKLSGSWQAIAHGLGEGFDEFDILTNNSHVIVIGRQSTTDMISWHSLEVNDGLGDDAVWHVSPIDGLATENGFDVSQNNGVLSLYVNSPTSNTMTVVELYPDKDNDHIFDAIDNLPLIPNQWSDQDGDGYGDNVNAPLSDNCPTQNGPSYLVVLGCFDADGDGYDDITDDCNTAFGVSWLGRIGCSDFDQDGWVDWNSLYPYGDIFSDNWKQAFDSDGDSYGDNHGPDCCDTWYDTNAPPGDEFPFNPKQYTDYDGDGYGDNSSDFIGGDACKFDYGTSYLDRLGCQDSDGDGASDPSNYWNQTNGADIWPNDPTQWADSDGDGFGDNGSKNATNPDYFPNNIAAANDSDEDGYPDVFTEFYNGTNAQGLQIDGCPLVAGNSTNPFYGCIDTDGDNYRDIYTYDVNPNTGLRENQTGDAFPNNPNQWADTDGDGFGDFQGGELADVCPNAPGVINGTIGIGCPLIDGNDDDGDFVINENDLCPNTQFGLTVDLSGCANNQLDDDNDGVTNDVDVCPQTNGLATVDDYGCSESQRQVDTDSDGVYDYLDLCPNTSTDDIPDLEGCSLSQKDSDSDGITDDIDVCPDTPENYPVLADGCTDESAKEIDWDNDGYTEDDEFMFESTQWADSDGDGYGDNPQGVDGDQCPDVSGTSTLDRLGCLDSDLDGYSDPTADFAASPSGLADAFINDITQWRDIDGDGYGDNATGLNPDLCPSTNPLYRTSVDFSGCAANERDTDSDGVVDSLDNCPNEPKGSDGYTDGCPLVNQTDGSGSEMILGVSITTFIAIVAGIVVFLLIVIVILRNRGLDDEDWFDEDDDYDDDFEEDRLSFLDRERSKPRQVQTRAPIRQPSTQRTDPPRNGPQGGPPPRSITTESSAQRVNIPSRGPPKTARDNAPSRLAVSSQKVARKVKKSGDERKKVRRAIVEIEDDIFDNIPKSSIDDAVADLGDVSADNERQLLMYLQENGWNAPQSRAIINLAKTKSR